MPADKAQPNPTFSVQAFGCPTSQYEAEALRWLLTREGFREAQGDAPDFHIINSCVVTAAAARKARHAARRSRRANPETMVVLMGCYPQVYPQEVASRLPEVEIITGHQARHLLPTLLRQRLLARTCSQWNLVGPGAPAEPLEPLAVPLTPARARPILKVQEGCDEACHYCIVTRARGPARSLEPQAVLAQARHYLGLGYRELVLVGTNLGLYGQEWEGWNLARLLQELDDLPGHYRVRLGYLEPGRVEEELLQTMAASDRVCPSLYLPLQSGSDSLLELMGRDYSAAGFAARVKRGRELIPGLGIQTDLIAGFPGETEEDHSQTIRLARELRLSGLHVFPFSPRPGTAADNLSGAVPPHIIKRRCQELESLHRELALEFHRTMQGQTLRIVAERSTSHGVEGFSDNYIWTRCQGADLTPQTGNAAGPAPFLSVQPRECLPWGIEARPISR